MTQLRHTLCALCETDRYDRMLYPASFDLEAIDHDLFSARRMPDRVHYRIVRCQRCGLMRSDPILEEAALARLYTGSHFTYGDQAAYTAQTYLRAFSAALPDLPRDAAVLEIGCGNGFFLQRLRETLGLSHVTGIEPSREALEQAHPEIRPRLIAGLAAEGLVPNASMDVVCAFQTFDHVPDPNRFLALVHSILRPRGRALFIQHDAGALTARLLGERSPIIDIEHTFLYNRRTLRQIFERQSFVVEWVSSVANRYPLRYWLHLMPLPRALKAWAMEQARVHRWGAMPLSLHAGNLGILARKA